MIIDSEKIHDFINNFGKFVLIDNQKINTIDLDQLSERSLTLIGIHNHLLLNNGNLTKLKLHKCENLIVRNCKVRYLGMTGANNNTFITNVILKMSVWGCRTNKFVENTITNDVYLQIRHQKWIFKSYPFIMLIGCFFLGLLCYFVLGISLTGMILLMAASSLSVLISNYLFYRFHLKKYNKNILIDNRISKKKIIKRSFK